MKTPILFILLFSFLNSLGQQPGFVLNRVYCIMNPYSDGEEPTSQEIYDASKPSSDSQLNSLFRQVQDKAFPQLRDYYELRTTDKYNNAMAHFDITDMKNLKRLVTINPDYYKRSDITLEEQKALLVFALAHEVAHHEFKHSDKDGKNVCHSLSVELEADDRAGAAVALLTNVDASFFDKVLPKIFTKPEGTYTHPPTYYRIMACKAGWVEGKKGIGTSDLYVNESVSVAKKVYSDKKDIYYGGITDGKPSGNGVYLGRKNLSGLSFIRFGQWEKGKQTGGGIRWSDGDIYEGEYKNGFLSGNGTFWFGNGGKYEGEFEDGAFSGVGTRWYSNGNKYEGEWKNGDRTGNGTFWSSDGSKYEGEYLKNERDGYGVYTFKDGTVYKGFFKDGYLHGDGYKYKNDEIIEWGCWEKGRHIGPECDQ